MGLLQKAVEIRPDDTPQTLQRRVMEQAEWILLPQAAEEKLLENPWLFRAPIVRNGRQATVGYCPDVWKTWE